MSIRLALTLDIRRDQAAPTETQHDTTLDAMVIDGSDQRHDAPRVGFAARQEEM